MSSLKGNVRAVLSRAYNGVKDNVGAFSHGAYNGLLQTGEAVTQGGNKILAATTNDFETGSPYTTATRGREITQAFQGARTPRMARNDAYLQKAAPAAYKLGDLATGFIGKAPRALGSAAGALFLGKRALATGRNEASEDEVNGAAARDARAAEILGRTLYDGYKRAGN
jgi:hypothetical protein